MAGERVKEKDVKETSDLHSMGTTENGLPSKVFISENWYTCAPIQMQDLEAPFMRESLNTWHG
jgi:hypothetical protein